MKILRLREVRAETGLPTSSIYLQIKNGDFPTPVQLTARCVGWRHDDVQKWIESRSKTKAA